MVIGESKTTTRLHFVNEPMIEVVNILKERLKQNLTLSFMVLNPDLYGGNYAGQEVVIDGKHYLYHSLRAWMDLATLLHCRMLTPSINTDETITLHFKKLETDSFHKDNPTDKSEKYGTNSQFSAINKNEEPAFFSAYHHALQLADITSKTRILDLGINQGDEFSLIQEMLPKEVFQTIDFVGIDHSQSTIERAKKRFNASNMSFYSHDINALDDLALEPFDLIITIGTLQSPGINYKPFLQKLVQEYLTQDGAVILGFPNSRWIDGEMIYGAKMRNYRESDLSLVLTDIDYAKRYLQQKKFNVRISGKEYIFLTAWR
jgi:2-polyprenyl-3-methyl-5-hydroxy-6-metoxy-1,4-benzoquinol methylase